ncbi:MAG: glycerol-3-phosphate 1-O-acyltransferase PlsY [Actinobacteria bacterium]|nr:glycerol-3-phosphate 1-O-acyltransferase PlsY [Actinomycetota bacterium]
MEEYLIIFIVCPLLGFLVGGIPFGVILTAARGVDIRTVGSGNIGATNVARALGRKWGYFCFVLDVLKGAIPTVAMGALLSRWQLGDSAMGFLAWALVGCAAVLGHVFPIYLKFRGGKGVATSAGVALAIWPFYALPALLALFAWLVTTLVSRTISIGSLVACLAFLISYLAGFWIFSEPRWIISAWSLSTQWPLLIFACLVPVLIIIRHRANITRLLTGQEHQIKLGGPNRG